MSYQGPSQPKPGLRHPSMGPHDSASTGQSRMLVARINEKKAELENLKQLRDLSGGLAAQMQALEEKLSTLSEGTEGWARRVDDNACHRLTKVPNSGGSGSIQLAQCSPSN